MKKLFKKDEPVSKTNDKPGEPKTVGVVEVIYPKEIDDNKEQVPAVEEKTDAVSSDKKTDKESKTVPENKEQSNKQKINALKRTLLNKNQSLEREKRKVNDWLAQAKDRDDKATSEFQKRKTELEELIKKSEERFNKRIAKTKHWYWDYSSNYTSTKIKKIEDDITLLEAELFKLEVNEPEPAKTE